jgi:hypothetical protein
MRPTKRFAIWLMLSGTVLCATGALAQSQQDTLADAARKAREEKKSQAKSAKVVTNDDLTPTSQTAPKTTPPETGTSTQTPADAAGQTGEQAGEQADQKPAAPAKDEAYWRQRFGAARANLARAEKELDILQREWAKGLTQYYNDPQKAMQQQNNRKDLEEHAAAIEAKKKDVDQLKQAITDLETELRQSGGDPGWAR